MPPCGKTLQRIQGCLGRLCNQIRVVGFRLDGQPFSFTIKNVNTQIPERAPVLWETLTQVYNLDLTTKWQLKS